MKNRTMYGEQEGRRMEEMKDKMDIQWIERTYTGQDGINGGQNGYSMDRTYWRKGWKK